MSHSIGSETLRYDTPPKDLIRNETGTELRNGGVEGIYIEQRGHHHFFPASRDSFFRTNLTQEIISIGKMNPKTKTLDMDRPVVTYAMNKVVMQTILTSHALPPITGK